MTDTSLTAKPAASARMTQFLRLLAQGFLVHWPFFLVAFAYVLTTTLLLSGVPDYKTAPLKSLALGMITMSIPAGLVAVFLLRLAQYPLIVKPDSPAKQMGRDIKSLFKTPQLYITGIPLFVAMVLFNKGMLELKPMIPVLKPFAWDQAFMELDRALTFGLDPWVVLQPVLGYDFVSFAIGMAYNFWFLVLFGTFMWFGFARQASERRTQFFLAYMLTWWIGGGLLAVYFSSAGPVYYSKIGLSPDPFIPLMEYLRDVDTRWMMPSLKTQDLLWQGYIGEGRPIGISAFPSMHNASALLFALMGWRISRLAGWCFTVYAAVILLGSVHLGWHYVVDGYAGFVIAAVCWWVSGHVARWHGALPSTRKFNQSLAAL